VKRKVVIITDCTDVAFLEMRGAIYSNAFNEDFVIEPIIQADAFSIVNGSFLLRLVAEIYPKDTLISIILNPLKLRTERIAGITERKNIIFEGTNTGVFGWLLRDFGCKELIELYDPGFVPFGGKYVHSPAIGKIVSGVDLRELGKPFAIEKIRDVKLEQGTIVHIDNFGNMKLILDLDNPQDGDRYVAHIGETKINLIYWQRMMERENGEWVIYKGSSFGLTEIGQVRARGALDLNIRSGDTIKVERQ
jgi:S-adenosylmethionine hydrolase